MRVRTKICGITLPEDARFAADQGADAVGFIFYSQSPRYVRPEKAAEIVVGLPPFVTSVGVFVNSGRQLIESTIREVGLRAIQLHGDETPEECEGFTVPVIRALRVGTNFDVRDLEGFPVNTFLLDTARDGLYGGTGQTFDWAVAGDASQKSRIILSGGIGPANVADAVAKVNPYGVDCGSGVEQRPGVKDHGKIVAFFKALKSQEQG
jgi:phosphoribosylanthranilate isomerase